MQPHSTVFEGQTAKGLEIQLRYPTADDLSALWQYINLLSKEQTYLIFQGEEVSYDDEAAWLKSKLDHIASKQAVMLLAFHGNELIAASEVDLLRGIKRHTGSLGISVAQKYRGQGVGEVLIRHVISTSYEELSGLEIITLEVFGNNPIAINLYRKVGFTEFGRIPGGIIHRGSQVDAVYMYQYKPQNTSHPVGSSI
jgi:ribosomal protein S18 acetylase RimI-like enzyme